MTTSPSRTLLTFGSALLVLGPGVGLLGHVLGDQMVSGMPAPTIGESVFLAFCAAPLISLVGLVLVVMGIVRHLSEKR
jgi:hypothetical protein